MGVGVADLICVLVFVCVSTSHECYMYEVIIALHPLPLKRNVGGGHHAHRYNVMTSQQ